jgi:DNA-directed RNA polymerase specialized sigma24 family protein
MSPYGALSDTTPPHSYDEAARCGNTQRPLTSQSAATGTEAHVSIPTRAGAEPTPRPYKPQAIELLIASREALERAKIGRLRIVSMAREHGLTNREIGEALGVDESAVRHMLKRAGEAA